MKLIIGLGNPGKDYIDSRHNIGFNLVRRLAKSQKIPLKKDSQSRSLSAEGTIAGQKVMLALPLTFMNLSGDAVRRLVLRYRVQPRNLLVVCDDLDLELGRIKIRPCGSCGGHRGLGSIIDSLGSSDFARLRIGIGRPTRNISARDYVLSAFGASEKKKLKETLKRSVDCCRAWITQGIESCMNNFNKSLPVGRQGAAKR
jgi:PTH1 family peptidyl-tRNA hydrolase